MAGEGSRPFDISLGAEARTARGSDVCGAAVGAARESVVAAHVNFAMTAEHKARGMHMCPRMHACMQLPSPRCRPSTRRAEHLSRVLPWHINDTCPRQHAALQLILSYRILSDLILSYRQHAPGRCAWRRVRASGCSPPLQGGLQRTAPLWGRRMRPSVRCARLGSGWEWAAQGVGRAIP